MLTCCWGLLTEERTFFQMGIDVFRNPEIEKASYSELVLFGPSKIFLFASPCHANCGETVDTSQRGSFRAVHI